MGAAIGDLNGDGIPEIQITNFHGEGNAFYLSQGNGVWEDKPQCFEKVFKSRGFVGWGNGFFDLDLDGDEDLACFNGHIHPAFDTEVPKVLGYKERPILFRNDGELKFAEVADEAGAAFAEEHSARGAAFGDFDEDGDIDVAVTDVDGPLRLFRNDTVTKDHFLKVKVEGAGKVNRDGYGARVTLEAGGKKMIRWVTGQGSYISQNDARAHFGLGAATQVDKVTVRWPGGSEDVVAGPIGVDRTLVVRAGAGKVAEIAKGLPMKAAAAAPASGSAPIPAGQR